MDKVIKLINKLLKKGIIEKYAIGGGIATIYYVEPILTYDIDIFFISKEKKKGILTLSSLYDWLRKEGYKPYKEHIIINGIPVQWIPVYNELIKDAVEEAIEVKYENVKTKVLKAEYLVAVMLQTFRPKDRERIIKILDEGSINKNYLRKILQKHKLVEKLEQFTKIYYGKQ